jgi:hypothetical protein
MRSLGSIFRVVGFHSSTQPTDLLNMEYLEPLRQKIHNAPLVEKISGWNLQQI